MRFTGRQKGRSMRVHNGKISRSDVRAVEKMLETVPSLKGKRKQIVDIAKTAAPLLQKARARVADAWAKAH